MTFTSQLIVERSSKGTRASVKEQGKKTLQLLQHVLAWLPCLSSHSTQLSPFYWDPTPPLACSLFSPLPFPIYAEFCAHC